MKLSQEEAELFFKLMWGLQFYVNEQCQILPTVTSVDEYATLSMSEKGEVRDALWERPELINTYVEKNPDGWPAEELEIVRQWKRFVSGTFQVFRHLKKHTVFIGEHSQVYGVLGLYDSLEEVYYGQPLPTMAETVLLPFKGKIVYDGLLKGYNILFGGGIRSRLKEEYMTAKQNGRIITTLEPQVAGPPRRRVPKPDKNWGAMVDEVVKKTERLRGGAAIQSSAFSLLRATAKLAQAAVHRPDDLDELDRLERQVRRTVNRLQTTLDRAEG